MPWVLYVLGRRKRPMTLSFLELGAMVGRTPTSAADAHVGFSHRTGYPTDDERADVGVRRGSGDPPHRTFFSILPGLILAAQLCAFQDQPFTGPQLVNRGQLEEALAVFRQDLEILPNSVAANNGVGVVLDLLGRYAEGRQYFSKAIQVAAKPSEKVLALRAMAVAWGFAGDCRSAEKYESAAYDLYVNAVDFYNAGEVADEMGRLCLDRGDLKRAYDWYEKGHQTGLQQPEIPQARTDLWNFRWANARARIAVRRGKTGDARKLLAEARTILDKGRIPDQTEYLPSLAGYVNFYSGDYAAALADLDHANGEDPFIRCLLAQTYEKLGNRERALEYYREAAGATAHSVPVSFARPFAQRKLQ
jgi:tetratricopeptide (TPR) repeat protein